MKNHFPSPRLLLRPLLSACLAAVASLSVAEKPAEREPERHELWVPTTKWKSILEKHPNAVMLTPEQYQALVRDAGKIKPSSADEKPPERAMVEGLHFKANATDESSEHLKLEGEMTLHCFTDEWTEVTARMPFRNLASATVDGGVVLGLPEDIKGDRTQATQRKLLVRGKGRHRITMVVLARPGTASLANTRSFAFQSVAVPAMLDLQLPRAAVITESTASYTREGDTAHVLLQAGSGGVRQIAWTTSSAITQPARQAYATGVTAIADHSIETAWNISIQRSTTDTSNKVSFDVIPGDAIVLTVEGEGIVRWQQTGDKLDVTLRDRTHVLPLRARVQSVLDLQASPTAQAVALPVLRFAGELATNVTTRIVSLAEGVTLMEYQGSTPLVQGTLSWNPVRDTQKVLLRKADPRITVDADAHIEVTRDDVQIDRTLQVQTDRPVNELRVTLPAGEEFITTSSAQGPAMDWKRVGQVLEYRWPAGLTASKPSSLKLQSRKRLTNASGVPVASSLTVASLTIPEAKKLAGYVALDFDPTWRVVVKTASGLEERDARITPVHGKMAWFALRDFSLAFEVQRRAPVFDAEITAYALPRSKTVEIESQVTLTVSDAPLRQFKVSVTKERAALLRFTSPLVSEQTLDAATGVWSLTLRKESMGTIPVRFRLSLPADGASTNKQEDANITIDARLPSIAVTSARRSHGVWVVEANTDTELTFAPQAMQPLDVLHAPAINDYQPRHRVVAAFDYAAPEAALTLHAARHGHSELAAVVINHLRLTSVLGHDGGTRQEAILDVAHSGEQFVNVNLPKGSTLLTSIADNQPVKPVRGPDGAISIPLPAGSASRPSVDVRLLYETPGQAWTGRGQQNLAPPTLPGNIPILATEWLVYTPDGFSIKKVKTDLEQGGMEVDVPAAEAAPVDFLPGGGRLSGIAEREIGRRVASMEDARQAIEKGDKLFSADDFEAALALYKAALEVLPNAPATAEWRKLAETKYADACVALANDRAKTGRYAEAHGLINEALKTQPGHRGAQTLATRLADPDRYPPALSAQRMKNVEKVERSLRKAGSYLDLGQYDNATKEFQEVLRNDPYNAAARRGMEKAEQRKSQYYGAARDHRRSTMIEQVDATWEEQVPVKASTRLIEKMKAIRFPSVTFNGASIDEAVEYLRVKSKELDTDPDTTNRGVNIILKSGDTPSTAQISLDLKDVPMEEALRYVTELAGMKFKVEPFAVLVVPVAESSTEMVTRVYKVPPDFLTRVPPADSAAAAAPADPFAAKNSGDIGPKLSGRKTAKEILTENGIPFPDGASAVFNPETSQLVVRNTAPNIDMVETLTESQSSRTADGFVDLNRPMERAKAAPAARREGLLSLDLELPTSGQLLYFHGPQAPSDLTLPYISADRQITHALAFMLIGAALFLALGWRRPVLATLLVFLLLALGIGLITEEWQPLANATLIGWVIALAVGAVWKLVKAFDAGAMEGRQA